MGGKEAVARAFLEDPRLKMQRALPPSPPRGTMTPCSHHSVVGTSKVTSSNDREQPVPVKGVEIRVVTFYKRHRDHHLGIQLVAHKNGVKIAGVNPAGSLAALVRKGEVIKLINGSA